MSSKADKHLHRKVRLVAPYPFTYQMRIKRDDVGKTILDFLHSRLGFRKKEEWLQRIAWGWIQQNEITAEAHFEVKASDSITLFNPRVIEPSVPDEVRVLDETADWLAVFKPAPMPVHPGGRYYYNSLTEILKEMGFQSLHVIHRLDAVTSGILLFAKSADFASKAQQEFMGDRVRKTYLARVSGQPKQQFFKVNHGIKRKKSFVFELSDSVDAKSAETHFEVKKSDSKESVLYCYPITGRTHQIRLHALKAGYPISDDYIYNPQSEGFGGEIQQRGISLMHTALEIPNLKIRLTCEDDW